MTRNTEEFDKFDSTMRKLIAVPHSEIKAKLEVEKAQKKRKIKKPSASEGRASGGKD